MVDELMKRAHELLDKLLDHDLQYEAQTGAAQIVDDLIAELQTLREERTAWRVTAENAEAAVKQARIDALEDAKRCCAEKWRIRSEAGFPREASSARALMLEIESLKGTP